MVAQYGSSQGDGVAAKALQTLGLDEAAVRTAVAFLVGRGEATAEADADLPFAPRAKRIVEFAAEESRRLRHGYVGTEHLLLALLREDAKGQEVASSLVLENLGVDPERVRRQVAEELARTVEASQTRGHVVTCRVDEPTLRALDALVEAGVHATRSEAAARLIEAGMRANDAFLQRVFGAVEEIHRVQRETLALARQWDSGDRTHPDEDLTEREQGRSSRRAET